MSTESKSPRDGGKPPSSRGPSAPQASTVRYKAALRKAIRRNAKEPEIDFLNITAMLDLMTIILVFLLQSMASSAASVQENDDLTLARSIMKTEPSDQGVILVISKSAILLGEEGEPVIKLPSREQLAQQGLDARHKRSGPNDLYIVPLANRLRNARKLDRAVRAAKGLDTSTSEAIIIADGQTPYRLLIEVLYTLGQSEFGKYHLMAMRRKAD
ncbi:MAG: biopolymer transporter ExbD [Myxococcales bacterium]|nr:biopolymer transporter ExbD [Myxococcales bacterium]